MASASASAGTRAYLLDNRRFVGIIFLAPALIYILLAGRFPFIAGDRLRLLRCYRRQHGA